MSKGLQLEKKFHASRLRGPQSPSSTLPIMHEAQRGAVRDTGRPLVGQSPCCISQDIHNSARDSSAFRERRSELPPGGRAHAPQAASPPAGHGHHTTQGHPAPVSSVAHGFHTHLAPLLSAHSATTPRKPCLFLRDRVNPTTCASCLPLSPTHGCLHALLLSSRQLSLSSGDRLITGWLKPHLHGFDQQGDGSGWFITYRNSRSKTVLVLASCIPSPMG